MYLINVRNVHEALIEGCYQMRINGVQRDSRNGKVLMLPEPLATIYRRPNERVIFHAARDANPFFHFLESVWMLAGRKDVAWVKEFCSTIGQFSDDGRELQGAYGFRWRKHFGSDQLHKIAMALRTNPDCRRQVLGMWDPSHDLSLPSKDVPCNVTATFQVSVHGELDMHVFNRSNDLIWGAYGANAVHFSILHEWMAAAVLRPLGRYYQISANTHVYERHWDLVEQLAAQAAMPPGHRVSPYSAAIEPTPLFPTLDLVAFGDDAEAFFAEDEDHVYYHGSFFHTANVIREAWRTRKGGGDAYQILQENLPLYSDWRKACIEWMQRRDS